MGSNDMFIVFLVMMLLGYILIPDLIELYTLNMYRFSHVSFTSIKCGVLLFSFKEKKMLQCVLSLIQYFFSFTASWEDNACPNKVLSYTHQRSVGLCLCLLDSPLPAGVLEGSSLDN